MPKPYSKAHATVAYDFSERRGHPKKSNKIAKKIANKGDRKAYKQETKEQVPH
jgi:hypothetical protein